MDQARLGGDLPRGADAPGDVRQPVPCGLGWADGEDRVLGASCRRRPVPGVRDQLRAPRLPRAMFPEVAPVHDSMSRRRVLRGRLARLRAAAPGALRVRVRDPGGAALGARWPAPNAGGTGLMAKLTSALRSVVGWLEVRTGLAEALRPAVTHPVPRRTASWWYVFGSATVALFALQIATGIPLALVYVPAADQAYQSLQYLNDQAAFGSYLRAVHFWGSHVLVLVMTLHMLQ